MTIQIPAQLLVSSIVVLVVLHAMLGATAYLILLERKVASWTQDRIGPNRTGFGFGQSKLWDALGLKFMNRWRFLGLGQALADGVKLFFKEDYTPGGVDKILFTLAPAMVMVPAMIVWAVIPWGGEWVMSTQETWTFLSGILQVTGVDQPVQVSALPIHLGAVYVLAVGSIGVYGMTIGSYASNNKFSFLGGLRATSQMLSYEIPMGLAVLLMILYYRTGNLQSIVELQINSVWGIFAHPLLAVVLYICMLAETNRAPFDLAEAEQELVGGFHTEYSSMRWALYFLGEYIHMIAGAAFFTVLFLGGWDIPFYDILPGTGLAGLGLVLLKFGIFAGKVTFLVFLSMWIRWTVPRFRFDQLMSLAWNHAIPMMLIALLLGGILATLRIHRMPLNGFYMYICADVVVVILSVLLGQFMRPFMPKINRKVPLEGSRYSPLLKSE